MNEYIWIDKLVIGEHGEVTEFTGGERRRPRPRWQKLLSPWVLSWKSDIVLERYTNPFDLPV